MWAGHALRDDLAFLARRRRVAENVFPCPTCVFVRRRVPDDAPATMHPREACNLPARFMVAYDIYGTAAFLAEPTVPPCESCLIGESYDYR